MASLKQIRRRIAAVSSTRKITRAMKMVAAAKMRKAQENRERARPYSKKLQEVISTLAAITDHNLHPLLVEREPQRVGVICVTSDRGMAGAFNTNICRRAQQVLDEMKHLDVELITLGRKGNDFFKKRSVRIYKYYPSIFQQLDEIHARVIGEAIIRLYVEGQFDRFYVVFNEFKNALQQNIVCEQFLPVIPQPPMLAWKPVDFIYEPDAAGVLEKLLPLYVNNHIWHVLLESYAAEQAARMSAMEKATDNANELVGALTLQFNKARQDAITKELLDIVGGAEGLK